MHYRRKRLLSDWRPPLVCEGSSVIPLSIISRASFIDTERSTRRIIGSIAPTQNMRDTNKKFNKYPSFLTFSSYLENFADVASLQPGQGRISASVFAWLNI